MSNDLSRVDLWASSGHSVWHRASALSKILFVIVMLGVVLFSHSVAFVLTVYAAVCALVVLAGVPLGPAVLLALYPVLFSSLYLLSRWDGTWTLPALLLLRSMTSSLLAVLLVSTTPYPDLFAPLSRVMPRLVGDGLFLTYRAFFLLVARADRMWAASKLRGGLSGRGLPKDLRFAGEGLGQLVIHAFDRSHRLYAVMQLRGHSGRVCGCRHWAEFGWPDLVPLSVACLALAGRWWWGGR
jgi:cobalt/nickel transport system permease protein